MSTSSEPRPYLNPYLAGALLGVVLFLAFFLTGGGLGASGALSHISAGVAKWFSPGHVNRVAYLADMAGGPRNAWDNSGVYMLVGTVLGGLASGLVFRRARVEIRKGPRIGNGLRLALAFAGGLIMAYGARMARGCTSGQALSGGAVLAVGSWVFMFAVFAGGYAVAYSLRRLWT
jgi:uncharacterized protein